MYNKYLVLGGTGFLGSHIVDHLNQLGHDVQYCGTQCVDLTDREEALEFIVHFARYRCVINCAAVQGGIGFNREHPVEILDKNVRIGSNVMAAAHEAQSPKVINILASCSYPDGKDLLREEEYLSGRPHESVAYHGMAKRAIYELGKAYHKQHGMNVVSLCLTNLYGPRANFHPEHSKVVEATIRKLVTAQKENLPEVEFWGTGAPLREFLFVKDAANLVVQSANKYSGNDLLLNIGSGEEITIYDLVMTVKKLVGYEGKIKWLTEKGDGQMRKLLDSYRMKKLLDVKLTSLEDGLQETIEWYNETNQ